MMSYSKTEWENAPSTKTPLNADNLNNIETGIFVLHEALDGGKLKGEKGDTGKDGVGIKKITVTQKNEQVTLNIELTDGTTQKPSFEIPKNSGD